MAQIPEFSLILAAPGLRLGQIAEAEVSLITLVGVITIGLSTDMILGTERLYQWRLQPSRVLEGPFHSASSPALPPGRPVSM